MSSWTKNSKHIRFKDALVLHSCSISFSFSHLFFLALLLSIVAVVILVLVYCEIIELFSVVCIQTNTFAFVLLFVLLMHIVCMTVN